MSSLRSPGPPPSAPPPPVPSSSSGINKVLPAAPHARPRPPKASRSSTEQPQWPARPQSQEIKDAAIWPVKAPRASTSSVARPRMQADAAIKPPRTPTSSAARPLADLDLEDVPAARPRPSKSSTESKRASLSALSLNRFSSHRSKPPSEEAAPPVPPIPGGPQRPLHPGSTVKRAADGRPVQGKPERLDSGGEGAVGPGSASRVPSVVRMPPQTLQKKRSFFRRVADKLTRSRSSLRDDAASQAASYEIPAASINDALPHNDRAVGRDDKKSLDARYTLRPPEAVASLPSPITPTTPPVSVERFPEPPTTTTKSTRKPRPPDIQIKPPPESSAAYPPRSPTGDQSAIVKSRVSIEQPRSPSKPRASVEQPRSPKPRMSSEQPHSSSRGRPSGEHARSTRTFTDKPRPPPLPTSPTSLVLPSSPTPLTLRSPRSIPLPHSPTLPTLAPTLAPPSPTTLPSPNTFPLPPPPPSPSRSRSRSRLVAPPSPSLSSAPPSPIDLPPVPAGPPPLLPAEHPDYTAAERRAAAARVSSWLTQPPTPRTSLDRASVRSHAFERGADDITKEADAADVWRAALRDADTDDVLPEVERMALEAEERVRVHTDLARAPTTSKKDSNRRSLSLFRRSTKAATPAAARTQTLPENRASRAFSDVSVPPASPRLPRTPVSPTMHTHGSILLETKDIEDPESRRLSEMVFLT